MIESPKIDRLQNIPNKDGSNCATFTSHIPSACDENESRTLIMSNGRFSMRSFENMFFDALAAELIFWPMRLAVNKKSSNEWAINHGKKIIELVAAAVDGALGMG